MTAADLIKILLTYPQDQRVVVDGYEDGYDDIHTVSEIQIATDANTLPQTYGHFPDTIPNDIGVGRHARAKDGAGEVVVYIKRPR
jgi:hypothetical protein